MLSHEEIFFPDDRQQIVQDLYAEKCSCIVRNHHETRVFYGRGIKDLLGLLQEEPFFLEQAFVADKVVGKGAAALMILGKVKEIFTDTISEPALELLRNNNTKVTYRNIVPYIRNRTNTGRCPVEKLCEPCTRAQDCLPLIQAFAENPKA